MACRVEARPDFLVVGAGIVGLAAAYHLAASCGGCRVLVVEKRHGPGHGDTGRSAAAFRAVFSSTLNVLLAKSSIDYYLEVQGRGRDLGMRLLGYLFVLPGGAVERFEEVASRLSRHGVSARWFTGDDLAEALGVPRRLGEEAQLMGLPGVEAGVLFQPAGVLRPEGLVEHY